MSDITIIQGQEKSNQELLEKSNEIIDSLDTYSPMDKWKVISSIYKSLRDILKEDGWTMYEFDKQNG